MTDEFKPLTPAEEAHLRAAPVTPLVSRLLATLDAARTADPGGLDALTDAVAALSYALSQMPSTGSRYTQAADERLREAVSLVEQAYAVITPEATAPNCWFCRRPEDHKWHVVPGRFFHEYVTLTPEATAP